MADTPDVLAKRWFDEVWDEGDESAIDRMMHPQALVHGLGAAPITGPNQFKPFFRVFHRALGDMQIDVVHTIVQGDMCAVHCHVAAGTSVRISAVRRPARRSTSGASRFPRRERPDRRGLELLRLPDDVSADRLGRQSRGARAIVSRFRAVVRRAGLQAASRSLRITPQDLP